MRLWPVVLRLTAGLPLANGIKITIRGRKMKDIWGRRLYRTPDGNSVPLWDWLKVQLRYRQIDRCTKGGKHVSEVGHGGDFCIKCGKVNP